MATALVGALRVNLAMDSAKFTRGMSDAQKRVRAARAQFMAFSAAAVALGTAVTAMAVKGANEIDRLAKAGRRLGTSVAGMRTLELVAGEAGVSVSSLTKDMQTLDRELARGSKSATAALDRLGLSARDLEGLEADQKMALLADAVADVGLSTGEATALLQDLGIRNREMVLALMAGSNAFKAARRDIEDYGLALSAIDAAAIEDANDAIGRLSLVGEYLRQQLAVAIVPAFGDFAQAMTDSLREGGLLRRMIDALVGAIVPASRAIAAIGTVLGVSYVTAVIRARIASLSLAGAVKRLTSVTRLLGGPFGLIAGALAAAAYAFATSTTYAQRYEEALTSAAGAQGRLQEALERFNREATEGALRALQVQMRLFMREQQRLVRETFSGDLLVGGSIMARQAAAFQSAAAVYKDALADLDQAIRAGDMEAQVAAATAALEALDRFDRQMLSAAGEAAWASARNALVDMVASLGKVRESVDDAAHGVITLDQAFIEAGNAASAMLNDFIAQQQAAADLHRIELEHGRDSLEYINARAAGERRILALKLDQAVAAAENKEEARAAADAVLAAHDHNARLEGVIRRLTTEYGLAEGAARKIAVAVDRVRDALQGAIGPAMQLRSVLGAIGSFASESALGGLLGPGVSNALGNLRDMFTRTTTAAQGFARVIRSRGFAGAAKGGGGGATESVDKLSEAIAELVAESQKLNATWAMTDLQASIWERLRDLGVEAASAQGQIISGLMTQIDHLRQLKEVTEEWRDTVVGAFTRFITQGGSFKQVLSQLIMKLAEMAAQSAMMNFWNASGASGLFGKLIGGLTKVVGSADGNAFNAGRVMAFADGGVIGGPTLFPMRGGNVGLMGEAGPEAIMPLKRGPDGRLGVEAQGSQTVVRVELSPNLVGQILQQAGAHTAEVVRAADKALPDRMAQVRARPRLR